MNVYPFNCVNNVLTRSDDVCIPHYLECVIYKCLILLVSISCTSEEVRYSIQFPDTFQGTVGLDNPPKPLTTDCEFTNNTIPAGKLYSITFSIGSTAVAGKCPQPNLEVVADVSFTIRLTLVFHVIFRHFCPF